MTFLNLPTRLAKALLRLTRGYGDLRSRSGKVTITQREISQIIGRSRESTNKQLRAWVKAAAGSRSNAAGVTVLRAGQARRRSPPRAPSSIHREH